MRTTRSRRRGSIARDVPVEYARAPIAVIVVAHMGANAVFLPNAKSADRADMMMRDKSTHDRGVTTSRSWGARDGGMWDGEGRRGMGRDDVTGHDSRWVSIHTTETSSFLKKVKHGTRRDNLCMRDRPSHGVRECPND